MLGNENIRTWEQFKALEIEEQVDTINNLLLMDHTLQDIAKSIEGARKGKPLDRNSMTRYFKGKGYERSKEGEKLFAFDATIKVTSSYKPKTLQNTTPVIDTKPLFVDDEVEVIHKLIKEYRIRHSIVGDQEEQRGETSNRNIRVYKEQYEQFAEFCKVNNLKQADALYNAINLLMDSFKTE